MSTKINADAQAEALILQAERLLADARASAVRVGGDESDGLTVLIHAVAMGIADMVGAAGDVNRVSTGVGMAARQISQAVPFYVEHRTARIGKPS